MWPRTFFSSICHPPDSNSLDSRLHRATLLLSRVLDLLSHHLIVRGNIPTRWRRVPSRLRRRRADREDRVFCAPSHLFHISPPSISQSKKDKIHACHEIARVHYW